MEMQSDELVAKGYKLHKSLDHHELIPFVKEYLKKPTKAATIFQWGLLSSFALFSGYATYIGLGGKYAWNDMLLQLSLGTLFSFLLIPIHEFIHVLAYRHVGARQTSYDVVWKKFYFMALADHFVANSKEFKVVALAPFVSISLVLLIALFLSYGSIWFFGFATTLLFHSMVCSGDFGLLSYFEFHKSDEPVTYDDVDNRISYFYHRQSDSSNVSHLSIEK